MIRLFVYLFSLLILSVSAYADEDRLSPDNKLVEIMTDWEVPGLAAVVVRGDEVLFEKGFGVLKTGAPAPVTPDTIFNVASCTKQFSAAALSLAVDEKLLAWNDPVIRYVPSFRVADLWVTDNLLIEDLVDNGTGFGSHQTLRLVAKDRADYIARLAVETPQLPFRSGYKYASDMFILAGGVLDAVTASGFETFVEDRFFKPLGMTRSGFGADKAFAKPNVATPHIKYTPGFWLPRGSEDPVFAENGALHDGGVYASAFGYNDDIGGSTGGLNTSVSDFGRWLQLLLNDGVREDVRLLSEASVHGMMTLQTARADAPSAIPDHPLANLSGYGRGLAVGDYRGRKIAEHEGWNHGFRCYVALLPEDDLAVAVFVNLGRNGNPARPAGLTLLDHYADYTLTDWSLHLLAEVEAAEAENRQNDSMQRTRRTAERSQFDETLIAGVFTHPQYGALIITHRDNRLFVTLGREQARVLNPWTGDMFAYLGGDYELERSFIEFQDVDERRRPRRAILTHLDGVIAFERSDGYAND